MIDDRAADDFRYLFALGARPTAGVVMMPDQVRPPRYPTAFSGLRAMSEAGLEITNHVHEQMTVPWSDVQRIRGQMGQQAYDMTPTLTVDLTVARSIFLAEGQPLWALFVQAVERYLPASLSASVWTTRLLEDPASGIVIYERAVSPHPSQI